MRTQRWIKAEDLIAECVAKHPLALSPDDAVMAEWFDLHRQQPPAVDGVLEAARTASGWAAHGYVHTHLRQEFQRRTEAQLQIFDDRLDETPIYDQLLAERGGGAAIRNLLDTRGMAVWSADESDNVTIIYPRQR